VIKIQHNSMPIVWQIDTSYNLPSCTGQVRWNGQMKCFEVDNTTNNNFSGWQRIDNTVQLQSSAEWEEIRLWAKKKIDEERRIEELAKQYPAVKDAKEKLDIIVKLVQDND